MCLLDSVNCSSTTRFEPWQFPDKRVSRAHGPKCIQAKVYLFAQELTTKSSVLPPRKRDAHHLAFQKGDIFKLIVVVHSGQYDCRRDVKAKVQHCLKNRPRRSGRALF
jgi:hypothetical protein